MKAEPANSASIQKTGNYSQLKNIRLMLKIGGNCDHNITASYTMELQQQR